jgi:hypothetical protein
MLARLSVRDTPDASADGTDTAWAPVKFIAAASRGQCCVILRQLSVGIGVP